MRCRPMWGRGTLKPWCESRAAGSSSRGWWIPGPLTHLPFWPRPLILLPVLALLLVLEGCGIPRWPVAGPMTSPFGVRLRGWKPGLHHGVDVAVPVGTPIRAMRRGRVIRAGWASGYGWMVMIDHGGQVLSLYAHLSEIRVQVGQQVRGQEVIGLSGKSGNVTGPHLHFEVWRHGWPEDPVPLLGGPPAGR